MVTICIAVNSDLHRLSRTNTNNPTETTMTNRRVRGLPASLLLDDKTFPLYCLWQSERNVGSSTAGRISSAFEHHSFLLWLSARSEVTSPVSQDPKWPKPGVCDHLFHPAQSSINKTCPICCVQICLDFLEVIRVVWMKHEKNRIDIFPRKSARGSGSRGTSRYGPRLA